MQAKHQPAIMFTVRQSLKLRLSSSIVRPHSLVVHTLPRLFIVPSLQNVAHSEGNTSLSRLSTFCTRSSGRDVQPVEAFELQPVASIDVLDEERRWVAAQVTAWLNEEWTPLDVHTALGNAAADAYCSLRVQGENEMGSILLGLSSQLMSFDFFDTFTDPFEVSNKVVELVMMRSGCDVCCTSPADKERMTRVSVDLEGGSQN
mmetsp:Transcript_6286/g.13831  ORF Transcript_6286/g.13831 Transcript_6286/m.13831 type:complete len:203 (-) Transcript_6286:529-1137(-)